MRSLGPRLLLLLLVALAAVLPYAGAHRNGFVYDDVVAVRDNPRVHGLAHARELFTTEYWNRPELPSRLYRPLTLLAIAAEWAWLGSEPGHFHVTNLVLHGLVSVAVTLLVLGALARRGPPSDDEEEEARDRRSVLLAAGAAGLLFAMHPLHSEAVLSIVGRAELLAALFTLLTLLALIRGGRLRVVAAVTALLALLAKESAILVVPFVALLAWLGLSAASDERAEGGSARRAVRRDLLVIAPGVLLALLVRTIVLAKVPSPTLAYADNPLVEAGPIERVLTAAFLFSKATFLHLLPEPLSPDYSIRSIAVQRLGGLGGALGLATWGFFAVVTWYLVRIRRMTSAEPIRRGLAFAALGFAWFGIGTLLSTNLFVLIGTLFAERLTYLPGIGLFLVFAALVKGALELRSALPQYVAVSFLLALLAGGTVGQIAPLARRTAAWQSNLTLFRQATRDQPQSFRVWCGLGEALMNEGKTAEAEPALLRSLSIYPDFGATHACLMSIYHDQGKNDLAMQHARELKRLVPVDARPYFVLSEAARAAGDAEGAARQAEEGLALDASYLPLHLAAGRAYAALHRDDEAIASFRHVISAQPQLIAAKRELGSILIRDARWRDAIALFREVVAAEPEWSGQNSLAWSLLRSLDDGRWDGLPVDHPELAARLEEAERVANSSVASAPAASRRYALDTLAAVQWAMGQRSLAIATAERLVTEFPDDANARAALNRYRAGR